LHIDEKVDRTEHEEELASSDLGPSGYVSSREVLRWIASIMSRFNPDGCVQRTIMYVYPYRNPTEHLAADIVSGTGARLPLTFHAGGRMWLDDTDPCVTDLAEAIHLTGLIARSLDAQVVLGTPIRPEDVAFIRSQTSEDQ
jgi:hypothetical protein